MLSQFLLKTQMEKFTKGKHCTILRTLVIRPYLAMEPRHTAYIYRG